MADKLGHICNQEEGKYPEYCPACDIDRLTDKIIRAEAIKEGRAGMPKVVCLCGSTRFIKEFQMHYERLTDEGCIVLTVGRLVPKHEQQSERKRKLDELHLRKIDLADEVFVINKDGYIGYSTAREIAYAEKAGKPVIYSEALEKELGGK